MDDAPDDGAHRTDGCPGLWRLVRATLDPVDGAITTYECELCGGYLRVEPSGLHPATV